MTIRIPQKSLRAGLLLTLLCSAFLQCAPSAAADAVVAVKPAQPSAQQNNSLDAATRAAVIATISKKLVENYVFPEVAEKMATDIQARAARGEYDRLTKVDDFAGKLTEHMREVSKDKHIGMRFSKEVVKEDSDSSTPIDATSRSKFLSYASSVNFGFQKYERLDGNIALIEIGGFMPAQMGGEVMSAAMTVAASADAMIIDLRKNGGGSPAMVALISSYLFDGDRVHLNDLYFREKNETTQFWTNPYVPGKRFGKDKPVYVLTSGKTFSAAEEFSYNLQNLKRATIVGETTGGGANPGDVFKIGEHFTMFIPTGRAISPITHTNWEGVGVKPDVETPPDQALITAQILALKILTPKVEDEDAKADMQKKLLDLEAGIVKMKASSKKTK